MQKLAVAHAIQCPSPHTVHCTLSNVCMRHGKGALIFEGCHFTFHSSETLKKSQNGRCAFSGTGSLTGFFQQGSSATEATGCIGVQLYQIISIFITRVGYQLISVSSHPIPNPHVRQNQTSYNLFLVCPRDQLELKLADILNLKTGPGQFLILPCSSISLSEQRIPVMFSLFFFKLL